MKIKVLVDTIGWISHKISLDYMDLYDIRSMAKNWVKSNDSDWVIEIGSYIVTANTILAVKIRG